MNKWTQKRCPVAARASCDWASFLQTGGTGFSSNRPARSPMAMHRSV
ncbi:hypothetical protein [Domibacillus iocasae]|nr:hypothetical protein [Domibacillus iocasae]